MGSYIRYWRSLLKADVVSRVDIRVGTPPQWVSVFPNTAGEETWVIGRDGCDGCTCFIPLHTLGDS